MRNGKGEMRNEKGRREMGEGDGKKKRKRKEKEKEKEKTSRLE